VTVELNDAATPPHETDRQRALSLPPQEIEWADRVAIVSAEGSVTYQHLHAMAEAVARQVQTYQLGPDDPVGICAKRRPLLVAAILGILKAGAAYVPLDPEHPRARIDQCLRDCKARLVLVDDEETKSLLPDFAGEVLLLSAIDFEERRGISATSRWRAVSLSAQGSSLAYIMHTSGSTNQPKGVMVTREAVSRLLDAISERCRFQRGDVMLAVTTVSFDISVVELFLPLMVGARIVLADGEDVKDGRRLHRLIRDEAVTVMQATPAGFGLLCASGWTNDEKIRVLCGGDVLSADLAKRFTANSTFVLNLYGPTETTIWSMAQRIRAEDSVVSIGRPIGCNRTYLLNDVLAPVPVGGLGEIYIGGPSVARGYLGAPGLTAARFVPDPIGEPGSRLYRTGDFGRVLASGILEFRGRRDGLVKVRGHRVECGEIELALRRHPCVADAAVQSATDDQSVQLVAYLELSDACTAATLRQHLLELLPSYMVPSRFRRLATLPRTANGKLDRGALARSSWQDLAAPADTAEERPSDPVLDAIVEALRQVLGVTAVSVDDNFFELGAHSLAMAETHRRLMTRLGADFELSLMFRYPTPRSLAERLRRGAETPDEGVKEVREAAERQSLSAREHRLRVAGRRTREVDDGS
jgi:amino acid adenylation domain-containing protein